MRGLSKKTTTKKCGVGMGKWSDVCVLAVVMVRVGRRGCSSVVTTGCTWWRRADSCNC